MKKIIFLLLLLTSFFNAVIAQQPLECGKYKIDTVANEAARQFGARNNSPLAVTRLVRVYFYIVANDDGSNAAATPAQLENEFSQLVNDYSANSLCFANMGFRYIYSSNINNNINCDVPASYAALNPWLVPNCITIFYQRVLGANGGGTYGGNAYAIPNTYCSVATGNINAGRTLTHEVGHCLGLWHTFEGAAGNENINGSNCGVGGDQVCDTPSDPWGRGACFSRSGCSYTGNCVDANGQTNFSPPYTNIMSYWWLGGCVPSVLTGGQYARLNNFINTNAGLQGTLSASNSTVGPSTYNSTYGMLSAIFNLNTTGAFNCTNNCVVSLTARTVTLTNGFRASPTTGKVTIKGTTCFY
jgi:Pregnancy-associated plasma protein-A